MHFTIPGAYIQEISEHQASLSLTQALIDCPGITSSPCRTHQAAMSPPMTRATLMLNTAEAAGLEVAMPFKAQPTG
jgi:hypothetical protein